MKQSISLRFIKLGCSLLALFGSCVAHSIVDYYFTLICGGILLVTAFASFGSYDYRGNPSKLLYKIVRYSLAILLLVLTSLQIYLQVFYPNSGHYSSYTSVVDFAIISYLIMFKPSYTTKWKKFLKGVGYIAILTGINAFQNAQIVVTYYSETSTKIDWGAIFASFAVIIIGTVFTLLGGLKSTDTVVENKENIQITDVKL
jgi:hypothetical protein